MSVTVKYPHHDLYASRITFVGSVYGGPVVMVTGNAQTFVTDPARFGSFGTDWVRRFFA